MIRGASALALALTLLALGSIVAAQEVSPPLALPAIIPGTSVTGAIEASGERDAYALTIDSAAPASLLDIRLIARTGPARRVCVEVPPGPGQGATTSLACDQGVGGAVLRDLLLAPGGYLVVVDGEASPDRYVLVVDRTSAPLADHESEPNDAATLAMPWEPSMVMQGWHEDGDADHYALRVSGEPQRWRLEVTGAGVVSFSQVRITGAPLAAAGQEADGTWVFPDAYLGPGGHLFRIDGRGTGAYSLTATPLGPPDPDAELEPNDVDPEPLPVGTTRTGLLASTSDEDRYRFSVTADDHIRLRIEPPADGSVYVTLTSSTLAIAWATSDAMGAPVELDQLLVPEDYVIRVTATHPSAGRYRISLTREDPFAGEGTAEDLPVELKLREDGRDPAAFWPAGQVLPATLAIANTGTAPLDLSLDARTSDLRWTATIMPGQLTVGAGTTRELPVTINVPADATRVPVRITIRTRDATGAQRTASLETTPARDAPPVGERTAWSVPDALLGGIDVAATRWGAVPIVSMDEIDELALHDGASPTGGGLYTLVVPPVAFTVDLAGDGPLPVVGMLLDPVADWGAVTGVPRDVELLLSQDGVTWQPVLEGQLSPAPIEQAFVLPLPVDARFAQLRITSTWGQPGVLRLGEWKVVAAPGVLPAAGPVDLADPARGGHVAWMDPQPSSPDDLDAMLHGDLQRIPTWLPYAYGRDKRATWVVAFQDDRAARVTSLGWEDPAASDPTMRFRTVDVAISAVGPGGPWQDVGTWRLRRAKDGSVAPFALDEDVWVRAIRFRGTIPERNQAAVELPARIHASERPADATYRSITGEWGAGVGDGPREWSVDGAALTAPPIDRANHTPADAVPLESRVTVEGRVQRGVVDDWYAVTIPEDQRTLELVLGGTPFVGTTVQIQARDGTLIPVVLDRGAVGQTRRLSASVEPGATYLLRVHQPALSAVIALDTSASIDLTPVAQALDAYARGIVAGEEWVQLLPFGGGALLEDWSDDRWEVADALTRLIPPGSSSVEPTLIDAADLLATREGSRAILLLTDAETDTFRLRTETWQHLREVGPVVFPVHVSGAFEPIRDRQLMQDLAALGGGRYAYAPSRSALDVAFDRMTTWLRRPAQYSLAWTSSPDELAPPEPGLLAVIAAPGADGSAGIAPIDPDTAIEIVLDTSGSMRAKLGKTTRIAAAKDVLTRLVREDLPPGVPVALRWFRQAPRSCDTELAVPLGPLDPEAMASIIEGIRLDKTVRTPLAAAIDAVADDLADVTGPKVVVVVSDGQESCKGDPEAAVGRLRAQGIDVTVNVVGLGLRPADRKRIRRLASLGGGTYFDAAGAGQLNDALRTAVSAPFEVFDQAGELVGRGSVNGPAVKLPPGLYRVVVLTDPEHVFEDVLVESRGSPALVLPAG